MANIINRLTRAEQYTAYEIEQRRKTLKVILWVVFIGGLILSITNFVFGYTFAGITVLVLCAASLAAMRFNQQGNYFVAAAIISALLFSVVTYDIVDAGGLGNDLGIVAVPVVILACSLFFGKRGLAIFSGLSLLAVISIGELDIHKVLYAPPVETNWGDLLTVLVLLTCTAVLLWLILDNAEKNLKKLQGDDALVRISYALTLEGLVKTLELRDQETELHSRRVVDLSLKLASALGLSEDDRLAISRGALLHDIGKLGVPDHILLKQGPLTDEEWIEMRKHPVHARAILANIPFLQPSISIPFYHHERWDGAGYPGRLKGENISYFARLFSIVDQWEALTSDRVYRKAWPREKAMAYVRENSGVIYDPAIAEVFLASIDAYEAQPAQGADPPMAAATGESMSSPKARQVNPAKRLFQQIRGVAEAFWVRTREDSPFDKAQRSRILTVILWVTFLTSLGLGVINWLGGGFTPVSLIIFGLSGFSLFVIYINSKGQFMTGAIGISLLMLLAAGANLYTWGGLHDMGIVAFPAIVIICGLFFGKHGLGLFSLLAALIISGIGLMEINHGFKPLQLPTDIWDILILVVFILSITALLWAILDIAEMTGLKIKKKEIELKEFYDLTLEGFARAFEFRGREPEGHTQRVMDLSLRLAKAIGIQGSELEAIRRGAMLHDIGTLFIPDRIMLKPGPLDAAERLVMQQHPDQARDLLAKIPYLQSCIDIPYCHHEYWDGSGYPRGLKGEAIPLAARLFTLVDHWEELSCDRPFRQAWAPGKVLRYIQENAGRLYDPELTRIFIELVKADAPDSPQALTEVVHPIQRTG